MIWLGITVLCLLSLGAGALIAVVLERRRDREVQRLSTTFDTTITTDAPEIPMRWVDMGHGPVLIGQRATIRFEDGREIPLAFRDVAALDDSE